jgi:hypothetical protein
MNRRAFLLTLASFTVAAVTAKAQIVQYSGAPPTVAGAFSLPAERVTTWNPGFYFQGGLPVNNNIYVTLTPSGGNDLPQIQAALDNPAAAGKVVLLSGGPFLKQGTDPIWIKQPNVILRGSGPGVTEIRCQDTSGAEIQRPPGTGSDGPAPIGTYLPGIIIGPARYGQRAGDEAFSRNLAVDGVKGQNTITLVDVTGLSVGDFVVLDEVSGAQWVTDPQVFNPGGQIWARSDYRIIWPKHNPEVSSRDGYFLNSSSAPYPNIPNGNGDFYCRLDRPLNEVKEITAINTSTKVVTFSTPLHLNYHTVYTAQVTKYNTAHIKNVGVENLTIRGATGVGVQIQDAAYCWLQNVQSYRWAYNPNFNMERCFRVHVRSCDSFDCVYPRNASGSYSLCMNWATSDSIYENCVSQDCDKVTLVRASGRGCVYGYNYFDKGFIDSFQHWMEVGANASHFCGSSHVLFEGNYSFNADSDITAGPSNCITWFRNHLRGIRSPYVNYFVAGGPITYDDTTDASAGPLRVAGLQAMTYWCSYVGNVLGLSGQMAGWTYETDYTYPSPNKNIYYIGWDNGTDTKMKDLTFVGHIIRAGNWDWLPSTGSQKWEDGAVAGTIVNSMYLAGKPSFFAGGDTWPWVDPTTGTTYNLPAKTHAAGLTAHPPP